MSSNSTENYYIILAKQLIQTQFPEWKDLLIKPVMISGWDNRTFHLGDNMIIRLPSALIYAKSFKSILKLLFQGYLFYLEY